MGSTSPASSLRRVAIRWNHSATVRAADLSTGTPCERAPTALGWSSPSSRTLPRAHEPSMIESQVPPGALRARRLLLGAAVFSWIGVAASAGFVYVRSAHQHDRIARSLAWIEQNERVER